MCNSVVECPGFNPKHQKWGKMDVWNLGQVFSCLFKPNSPHTLIELCHVLHYSPTPIVSKSHF